MCTPRAHGGRWGGGGLLGPMEAVAILVENSCEEGARHECGVVDCACSLRLNDTQSEAFYSPEILTDRTIALDISHVS